MGAFESGAALCAPFLEQLPVAGVSISVVSRGGVQSTVAASDLIAARLEELQFQFGEGPSVDVIASGRLLLVHDLADEVFSAGWPIFGPAARATGAQALFTLPLSMGAATVGVVSLYALMLRPRWSDLVVEAAVALAVATMPGAVELAVRSALAEPAAGRQQSELRREVHQAAGMVSVQLDCDIEAAMSRLRAHAFVEDLPLELVARQVVAGRLNFGRLA